MVCFEKRAGSKEHWNHNCYDCAFLEGDVREEPCKECSELPGKCAWTPKEE